MEYAKDEVFSIQYNVKKDKLEYPMKKQVGKNRTLMLLATLGVLFSILNFILIYWFFSLLSTI